MGDEGREPIEQLVGRDLLQNLEGTTWRPRDIPSQEFGFGRDGGVLDDSVEYDRNRISVNCKCRLGVRVIQ